MHAPISQAHTRVLQGNQIGHFVNTQKFHNKSQQTAHIIITVPQPQYAHAGRFHPARSDDYQARGVATVGQ